MTRRCAHGQKGLLCPQRIRQITGSFAFIEHRFLQRGYWGRLSHHELLLYVFLETDTSINVTGTKKYRLRHFLVPVTASG
jgi:hypothetical protein